MLWHAQSASGKIGTKRAFIVNPYYNALVHIDALCLIGASGWRAQVMDEQEFRARADESPLDLYRRLMAASTEHGFDADFNSGALAIEFEAPPAKFVVSPNTPVRQIWVSAHSKSFKLDWDPARAAFVLPDGQTLVQVIG